VADDELARPLIAGTSRGPRADVSCVRARRRVGRGTALTTFAVAALFFVGGSLALRRRLAEEWWLLRLGSSDDAVREIALERLGEVGSTRCVPRIRAVLAAEESHCTSHRALDALCNIGRISTATLGHASREWTGMQGMAANAVVALLGPPRVRQTEGFSGPMYAWPQTRPAFDEQWIYFACLDRVIVHFKDGRVVLAVEEWSDF
jgi:hypothetical protein